MLLLLTAAWLVAPPVTPCVTWLSQPVAPDETLLLTGGGLAGVTVELGRVPDDARAGDIWPLVEGARAVTPLLQDSTAIQVVVPRELPPGLFAVRLGGQMIRLVNAPEVWWLQGDQGDGASAGGWVRLFGRCLGGGQPRIALLDGQGVRREFPAESPDAWSLHVALPADLTEGEYRVEVHRGFGGALGWQPAGTLTVSAPAVWKTDVFDLRDFPGAPDLALQAALTKVEQNGGGVVLLPRGRLALKGELALPAGTILRGAGMGLTSLVWPDFETPPQQLLGGPRFGLEDLALYCQQHKTVVTDQDSSVGTFLRRVRIRANAYFMIEEVGKPFRGQTGPATHREANAAIMLRGRNFEVTDCDIYATNYALRVFRAKVGVVARNQLRYGGRGYSIEFTDKLIFADNLVEGNNLLSIGNDITTFWNNYCRNIYYARNTIRQMYGADREMMTLDAAGGAYFGRVAAVDGVHLTLAEDPVYRDYAPKTRADWRGAAVVILDGTGAGQWRAVAANDGRAWAVDRPWDIPPDETSLLSIIPHRGRHLFIDNTFTDGGAFQLYGAALDTVVAGNRGTRMDGFFAWGLNPHGWGWQPCFGCEFLGNEILEGNGYGARSAMIGAFCSNNNETYGGPLARGLVFRGNRLENNARMRFHSTLRDVLVERNVIRHNDQGIVVGKGPINLLLRDNRFEAVDRPYDGDGLPAATIWPRP